MAIDALAGAYNILVRDFSRRSGILDEFIRASDSRSEVSLDSFDERYYYEELSSREGGELLERIYELFIVSALEANGDDVILLQLEVFQHLLAKKLWKYHSSTSEHLDCFTRSYDRLDQLEERQRWFREIRRVP